MLALTVSEILVSAMAGKRGGPRTSRAVVSLLVLLFAAFICTTTAQPHAVARQSLPTLKELVNSISDLGFAFMDAVLDDESYKFLDQLPAKTLFLPTNIAFLRTAADLGYKEDTNYDVEKAVRYIVEVLNVSFTNVLLYHVVPETLNSTELLQRKVVTTLFQNKTISVDAENLALIDLAPNVTNPKLVERGLNQKFDTGVVHAIDRLLLPVDVTAPKISPSPSPKAPSPSPKKTSSPSPSSSANATVSPSPSTSPTSNDEICFPASANVHLPDGRRMRMADLQAGHSVVIAENKQASAVYLFSHRRLDGRRTFIRISSVNGHSITISRNHYVYANGRLTTADNVKKGDVLRTLDGPALVRATELVEDYGLIAPHTLHGDIVVDGIVASTYTRAVHPGFAHFILAPLRTLVRLRVSREPLGSLLYHGGGWWAKLAPKGPSVVTP